MLLVIGSIALVGEVRAAEPASTEELCRKALRDAVPERLRGEVEGLFGSEEVSALGENLVGSEELGTLKWELQERPTRTDRRAVADLSFRQRLACLEWLEQIEKAEKDQRFIDARALSFFVSGAKLSLDGAYTNNAGERTGPGTSATADLDDGFVGNAMAGWFEKPVLRDLYLLGPGTSAERLEKYRAREDFWKWGLMDAVKLDLNAGYGSVITDPEGDNNFSVDSGFVFQVGLTYELPFEKVFNLSFEEE